MIRTTPGQPESVDIVFLDAQGIDLSVAAQRKLERVLQRQEFRRAFPGEIGDLSFPPRAVESYVQDLLRAVDLRGVGEAELKVVVDCAGGVAALVLPTLLGRVGVEVLVVNGRLDDNEPTETSATRRAGLRRLASLVASSGADFGVRYDPVGERIRLVDETGAVMGDQRALLVFLDLVAAETPEAQVALPVTTTRVAEPGVRVPWARGQLGGHDPGRPGPRDVATRRSPSPATAEAASSSPRSDLPSTGTPPSCASSGWSPAPASGCRRSMRASPRHTCSVARSTPPGRPRDR